MPIKRCLTCGKPKNVFPCHLKRGQGNYCSRRCHAKTRTGSKNSNWKGGRVRLADGRIAVYAKGKPGAVLFGGTHILEYRLIAAKKLGRPLRRNEVVHHINGNHLDNRPSNLQVMTQAEHCRLHMTGNKHAVRP